MTDRQPNSALARRVEEQLAEAGLQVVVESSDGALVLSGVVEPEEARQAVDDIASQDGGRGDEALADAVRRELAQDSAPTDLVILVAVREGVVHLRGQVADMDDADNAEAVASRVPGVREVVEELDVTNV